MPLTRLLPGRPSKSPQFLLAPIRGVQNILTYDRIHALFGVVFKVIRTKAH